MPSGEILSADFVTNLSTPQIPNVSHENLAHWTCLAQSQGDSCELAGRQSPIPHAEISPNVLKNSQTLPIHGRGISWVFSFAHPPISIQNPCKWKMTDSTQDPHFPRLTLSGICSIICDGIRVCFQPFIHQLGS